MSTNAPKRKFIKNGAVSVLTSGGGNKTIPFPIGKRFNSIENAYSYLQKSEWGIAYKYDGSFFVATDETEVIEQLGRKGEITIWAKG